jgi:predicted metal-dependent phosphoesterase TrpH
VIDLHTHTAASDGRLPPQDLVREAWTAGIRVLAVTDHDTLGGVAAASQAAAHFGLRLITGVEVTAIESGRDVHVLGYFVDAEAADFGRFLAAQRAARVTRVREIGARLEALGAPVDVERLLTDDPGHDGAVGRPAVAAALVQAGHARTAKDAFDRFLGTRGAAFVPRVGPGVADAIVTIHAAGGIASLAHPFLNRDDARIAEWARGGLDAIEVYHSDHDAVAVARYRALAGSLGLAVTGGSDYHGDDRAERARLGRITLPVDDFENLERLAAR